MMGELEWLVPCTVVDEETGDRACSVWDTVLVPRIGDRIRVLLPDRSVGRISAVKPWRDRWGDCWRVVVEHSR